MDLKLGSLRVVSGDIQAEEQAKIQDLEATLKALNASTAVIEFKPDGTILHANQNFLDAMGYRLEQIQGQHHSLFMSADEKDSPAYRQHWQKLQQGQFVSGEFKRIGASGQEVWIQASYNPIFDAEGKVYKVIKFASDITAQKQQEAKNRIIANQSSALKVCDANVMLADNDLNIVYFNDANEKMLRNRETELKSALPGFAVDKLIGTNVDIFHKNPAHQRDMLAKLTSPYHTRIKVADLTFNLIASPWIGTDGNRLGTVVEWDDVTERVAKEEQEKAVLAENTRIRQALDGVSTNVMMADKDNNIVYVNHSVMNMMRNAADDIRKDLPNFNPDTLIGSNVDIFHKNPSHQRNMLEKLSSTYRTQISVGGRFFNLIANPVLSDDKERIGTVVEWADVTDQVKVEQEVQQLVEQVSLGQLGGQIPVEDKQGFFLNISEGLNRLSQTIGAFMGDMDNALARLSQGDLDVNIASDYQGTFGDVKLAIHTTASKLEEIVGEISQAASEVTSGVGDLKTGNADLSSRTEQQASSLEETAASMEEMTSTIQNSAVNSQQANELSTEARTKAQAGGEIVKKAIDSMQAINDASKRINDIIGVIDEIAFQTNLLALNAAVEAARAGEQGRGFAVVASEVRNLAQRSAAAAKEIKELISDSVVKVDEGTLLVNQSGDTLAEIVDAVHKVSEMVSSISETAKEQSSGISEINQAVTSMDTMTQQNAAMVEQATAASESLDSLANQMLAKLSFFRMQHAAAAPMNMAPKQRVKAASVPVTPAKPVIADSDDSDDWEEF